MKSRIQYETLAEACAGHDLNMYLTERKKPYWVQRYMIEGFYWKLITEYSHRRTAVSWCKNHMKRHDVPDGVLRVIYCKNMLEPSIGFREVWKN